MSIYATCLSFDDDEHDASCARMVPLGDDESLPVRPKSGIPEGILSDAGSFYLADAKACTCGGEKRQPVVYEGSHITPVIVQRGGQLDLGTIPPLISPRGIEYDETEETRWDFLRLSLTQAENSYGAPEPNGGTMLLDRDQIIELRDFFSEWLERGTEW